ncbi:MAG: type II toxin-antitoxin system death-on-curing family toxin [bacterium]|nr:type II toxin-antitoxin system death-on-curing family toxin [bacterium]MDE0287212.1 type II toxin-antitoxin system death-on-curing family toxin [bacterium]MDE0438272.1 type II toxin-antitoxin system death-on-curing family toxin [bacterium]
MNRPVSFLDLEDLLYLAGVLLGNPPPVREVGLLGAAVARPQTTVFGDDAYPDLWTKAAALLQSIVKGHPLVDGNKRLGWLATATFLEINGIGATSIPNQDVFRFVMRIAAGRDDVDQMAGDLRQVLA